MTQEQKWDLENAISDFVSMQEELPEKYELDDYDIDAEGNLYCSIRFDGDDNWYGAYLVHGEIIIQS